jgi:hypothetical protein
MFQNIHICIWGSTMLFSHCNGATGSPLIHGIPVTCCTLGKALCVIYLGRCKRLALPS